MEEKFKFPLYFKTILAIYYFLFISPYRYHKNEEIRSTLLLRIFSLVQKVICIIFHVTLITYIIVYGASIPLIKLKKHPTKIFEVANFITLWLATLSVINFLWFKQSSLREIIESVPVDTCKSRKINFAIIGGFIITPIGLSAAWMVHNFVIFLQIPTDVLDREILTPILNAMFIKPNSAVLEVHERILAFLIVLISRFNIIFASVITWMTFLGGLSIYEINSVLLRKLSLSEGNILESPIMRDTLPKIQNLMGQIITPIVVACNANFVTEVCVIGEYSTVDWWIHLAQMVIVIGAIMCNAAATAKGNMLVKAILLKDSRFVVISSGASNRVVMSETQYWSADVSSLVSSSITSANGLFGPITYGSLGFSLWFMTQLAIVMIQFLEQEKGTGEHDYRVY